MSRWIDAEYCEDFFDRWESRVRNAEPVTIDVVQNTRTLLRDAPTIDIVHCKDCKYWTYEEACEVFNHYPTCFDDFCSYGKRKSIDDLIEQADNLIAFERDLLGDCNLCRFAGCSECDYCINGSQWVRMTEGDEE